MEIFEVFSQKAKEFAGVAGKKTETTVELSRLKIKQNQLEGQLKIAFERIGTLVYEESQGFADNSDLIELCIRDVSAIQAEKRAVVKKISQMREKRVCPACKKENAADKSYCTSCGAKLC